MDKISKFLRKLKQNEHDLLRVILHDIQNLNIRGYDVKMLKGYKGMYLLRKGDFRIVFYKKDDKGIVFALTYRKDAYK